MLGIRVSTCSIYMGEVGDREGRKEGEKDREGESEGRRGRGREGKREERVGEGRRECILTCVIVVHSVSGNAEP